MGGGKGGSSAPPQYDPNEGKAYLERYPDVYQARMDPWYHYTQYGRNEGRKWGAPEPSEPSPADILREQQEAQQQFLAEQQAQQQAEYERQQAEALRQQGIADRDKAYSNYMDAANTATDFVTNEIQKEQSNANLLGVEYSIDDEQKQQRINDYFASIWGGGQQSQLKQLMNEWGKPKGFSGFSVTRGDGSKYAGKEGSEKTVTQSKGEKPKVLLNEDEDENLGAPSILGA